MVIENSKDYFFRALPFLRNKYIATWLLFLVWLTFFESEDVFTLFGNLEYKTELQMKKEMKKERIEDIKQNLEELSNKKTLEKFAREHYLFKKENEDVFILVEKQEN